MAETAAGDDAWRASADDVRLRTEKPQRHGEILMTFRHRRMHAVAKFHLPPPGWAELPNCVQAGPLRLVGRLLGPRLVERFQAVVAPHRSGQMEAALDLQLARIDGPAGGDERLGAL